MKHDGNLVVETVDLRDRSYPIGIGTGLQGHWARRIQEILAQGRPVAVVTDAHLADRQRDYLQAAFGTLARLVLEAGEKTKSLAHLEQVYSFLVRERIDRTGLLVAFGGGVIGDLAGFAAATYLRGIDYLMAPTTLLAMVDSSVGGKTAVNLAEGKNLAGAFYQPQEVSIDAGLLHTLPAREFHAGMAEVIKYGLLGNPDLLADLESGERLRPGSTSLPEVIRICCRMKAEIVSEDERETSAEGGRALLNLGHTFAHAIEKVAGYGVYLHGEAVGVGLLLAARLSAELGRVEADTAGRVQHLLERYDLPTALAGGLSRQALFDAMRTDKKTRAGKLRLIGLERAGRAIVLDDVSEDVIHKIWKSAFPD